MTDYVRAYDNSANLYHKEARKLADQLRQETTLELRGINAGVLRWKSNTAVVPEDCAKLAYAIGIKVSLEVCDRVRNQELIRFFNEYRKTQAGKGMSPEELFEARAAFGTGAKVINLITGRETIT